MVEYTNTFKVAAVQAQPVWFDAAKTVDKTVSIIAEAARNGCELVAFPEVFIPGYPYHIWVDSPLAGMAKFAVRYHENSPDDGQPARTAVARCRPRPQHRRSGGNQ